jgi:hypothetical protein
MAMVVQGVANGAYPHPLPFGDEAQFVFDHSSEL